MAFLGAATLVAFLSGHAFPGEFAALFRLQYAGGLALVGMLAALGRRRVVAAAAAAFLLLDLIAVAPAWVSGSRPDPSGPTLRLLVANVWYPGRDYARFAQLIREEDPDVIGIVELSRAWQAGLAPALAGYRYRVTQAQPGAFGVGIFSRVPLSDARILGLAGRWPPVAAATVAVGGERIRLFVVHPPPPIRSRAARRHRELMRALGDAAARERGRALICGDLNATPWSGPFRTLLARGGLARADPWRPLQATWPVGRRLLGIPIDNCVAGNRVAVAVSRGPDIGSDHLPQLVEVGPAG